MTEEKFESVKRLKERREGITKIGPMASLIEDAKQTAILASSDEEYEALMLLAAEFCRQADRKDEAREIAMTLPESPGRSEFLARLSK